MAESVASLVSLEHESGFIPVEGNVQCMLSNCSLCFRQDLRLMIIMLYSQVSEDQRGYFLLKLLNILPT